MTTRYLVWLAAACSNATNPGADAPPTPLVDAKPTSDAAIVPTVDAGLLRILVINEVAAGESPDWFEVINATTQPIELADYVYTDAAGDLTKAIAFAPHTLAPGAYFAQDCGGAIKLGSDEELWIYRAADMQLSDGVDWNEGDSPKNGAYARDPDIFGAFATTTKQTKGAPNQF